MYHNYPFPDMVGLESYEEYVKHVRQAYSDLEFFVYDLVVDGDKGASAYTLACTHTGRAPYIESPPTGKRVSMAGATVFHRKADRVIEEWDYADWLGLLQQIGAIPSVTGRLFHCGR